MSEYFKQSCPLCATDAQYYFVDARNRKYFSCPKCSYFQISRRAEEILAELSQSRRDFYASEVSKAPENHLLVIRMPEHDGKLSPVLHVVPLQLLAYHTACARGTDVDKPRNLAKSVTVE